MKRHTQGFTLIELMIAVVIVGILSAIAMPSYQNYLVKSSRAAAQTELLEMASLQEKIYLNANAYTPNITASYNGSAAANNTATTGGLGKTSGKSQDGKYDFSIVDTTGTVITTPSQAFELRAVPAASKAQVGNGCILIRENGLRQWHENSDTCAAAAPKAW
jgi:type IV pilus assembly protein PilE